MKASKKTTKATRQRTHTRIRRKVVGTPARPRLAVSFTGQHIYAQIIDDADGKTLVGVSTTEKAVAPARERLLSLGLTTREADVLYWMTEGKQNREIATILGRSLDTVQEHVANILKKLGQENRHAATVFALRKLGIA
jgi:DNA-binding NarL/FixJ family response regulator